MRYFKYKSDHTKSLITSLISGCDHCTPGYFETPTFKIRINWRDVQMSHLKIKSQFCVQLCRHLCVIDKFLVLLCSPKNFGGAYSRRLVRPSVRASVSPCVCQCIRPIRVRTITSLFEVEFRNYFTEMTTMLRRRVAGKIWVPTLKVKVTARPFSKIVSGP